MSKHARKREARPPRVTKGFRLDSNDFGFIDMSWRKQLRRIKIIKTHTHTHTKNA